MIGAGENLKPFTWRHVLISRGRSAVTRLIVGRVADLPPGSRKIVRVGGSNGIGVFNVAGRYYALKNTCPHQGAEICLGAVTGTTVAKWPEYGPPTLEWCREGEILTCPWHHWEIEIATGKSVFPSRFRIRTYEVSTANAAEIEADDLGRVDTFPVYVEDDLVILETRRFSEGVDRNVAGYVGRLATPEADQAT